MAGANNASTGGSGRDAGARLGTLAASWTPIDELRRQIRWLRSELHSRFCVNLVLAFDQRERVAVVLEEGATAISFSWGAEPDLVKRARAAQAFVFVQVGSLREAIDAANLGAHGLILQGFEAGGHVQATRPLLELVDAIRPHVRVPLVAAGGIADAAGIKAARAAGADAVACGTVFLAAEEADVHPVYLDHLVAAGAADTVLTTLFDGGWPNAPHRVIRNTTVAAWEAAGMPDRGSRPGEDQVVASRGDHRVLRYDDAQPTRATVGDVAAMALYAGTSVRAVRRREPAASIVGRLVS